MPMLEQGTVHIDIAAISESEYEVACFVLASSIRLALLDEEKRKDFERWKASRKEVQGGY